MYQSKAQMSTSGSEKAAICFPTAMGTQAFHLPMSAVFHAHSTTQHLAARSQDLGFPSHQPVFPGHAQYSFQQDTVAMVKVFPSSHQEHLTDLQGYDNNCTVMSRALCQVSQTGLAGLLSILVHGPGVNQLAARNRL
jgi:hypothetical protein